MEYIPRRQWRYPFALEKGYYKLLKNYISKIFTAYKNKHEYVTSLVIRSSIKLDSDDEVTDFMESLQGDIPTPESMGPAIKNTMDIVNGFNKKEFEDILQSMRVNALTNEAWYQQYARQWISENLNLIKSIHSDTLRRIESELREAISTTVEDGVKLKYLENKIKEIAGSTDKRAALIARDQVGKLNGRITQYRQESTGIKKYTWRTMGDERVRAEHSERDGQIYQWNKPPPGGHPGMAIRCRCVALPVINFGDLAESGAYVPRANREAVREAMKRWGRPGGALYSKVIGADPVVAQPPVEPKPIKPVKPITAESNKPKVKDRPKTNKITKKTIIDKYAERFKKRNIVIDHKFAGYDKRMIAVTLKQLEILLNKFPDVKLGNESYPFKIKSMAGGRKAGAFVTYSHLVGNFDLHLKKESFSKFWRPLKARQNKKNLNIYTTKRGAARIIIAHEFGHIVHNHLLATKIGLERIRNHAWPNDYRKSLIDEFVKEIKEKAIDINDGQPIDMYMSKYGDTASTEWFAEAFCHAMMTNNKDLSPIGKAMLWYLKKEGLLYDDAT